MGFQPAITRQIAIEALYRPTVAAGLLKILSNIQFGAQNGVQVLNGASLPPIVDPVPFTPRITTRAAAHWSSTGFALVGMTNLILSLQQSSDGGATWTFVQSLEAAGVDDVGNPENRTSGAASAWLVTGLVPGTPYLFRVIASPVGGDYDVNNGEGSLLLMEVPE